MLRSVAAISMAQSASTGGSRYRAIRTAILARIENGEWLPGQTIPPAFELQERFSASRMTVLKAMHLLEEEGYISIEHGRGTFVRQRPPGPRIGILCGDDIFSVPPPPFAAAACQRLRRCLEEAGYQPQLYVVENYMLNNGSYPNRALGLDIRRGLLAGLVLIATDPLPALIDEAAARSLSVVDMGSHKDHRAHIHMDQNDMIKCSVHWLAQRGRRRLALIWNDDEQIELFRQVCAAHGLDDCPEWTGEHRAEPQASPVGDASTSVHAESQGFLLTHRLLHTRPRPDALIVTDDVVAKGVAQALLALGVRVPEDLLLLATGNSGAPFFYPVPMVRYVFDTDRIVAEAERLLLAQLRGNELAPCPPIRGRIEEEVVR